MSERGYVQGYANGKGWAEAQATLDVAQVESRYAVIANNNSDSPDYCQGYHVGMCEIWLEIFARKVTP